MPARVDGYNPLFRTCRDIGIRRVSLRCPRTRKASRQASPAGITGSSIHIWLLPVARLVTLYLGTQSEFALPARDYRVVAFVTGWYDQLQQSRLAAPSCPVLLNTNVAQPENITATKPESKQTGSECKHFARRKGVPAARRKTR